jgi:hypothetical protein
VGFFSGVVARIVAAMITQPELPYGGDLGPNSGWSGSDTSKARARVNDESGKTSKNQLLALRLASTGGEFGVTVAEQTKAMEVPHHGTASGTLSTLHKSGRLCRLSETRGGQKVYVLPEFVGGRDTEKQGRK